MRSHTEQRLLNVKQIASSFQTFTGGTVPQYIVAAPGRVNLIGEHIDHQGYPVLPVACSLSIYLAAGWSEPSNPDVSSILQITHCGDPQRYTQRVFKTPLAIALGAAHHWTDYIVCAFWAVIAYGFPEVGEKLRLKREASVSNERWLRAAKAQLEAKHVVLMVDGDLPTVIKNLLALCVYLIRKKIFRLQGFQVLRRFLLPQLSLFLDALAFS